MCASRSSSASERSESAAWLDAYHSDTLSGRRRRTYARKLRRLGLLNSAYGSRTLDIACGSGEVLTLLADSRAGLLFGVDLYAPSPRPREPFFRTVGDGTCLPFQEAIFDRVICMHSLHHLRSFAHIEPLLSEARRVLKQDGCLFLIDHFDSFYLRLIFRFLEIRCPFFPAALKEFGAQLREEHECIFWWLAHWRTIFQILERTGFQVQHFAKRLVFFYLTCTPRDR